MTPGPPVDGGDVGGGLVRGELYLANGGRPHLRGRTAGVIAAALAAIVLLTWATEGLQHQGMGLLGVLVWMLLLHLWLLGPARVEVVLLPGVLRIGDRRVPCTEGLWISIRPGPTDPWLIVCGNRGMLRFPIFGAQDLDDAHALVARILSTHQRLPDLGGPDDVPADLLPLKGRAVSAGVEVLEDPAVDRARMGQGRHVSPPLEDLDPGVRARRRDAIEGDGHRPRGGGAPQ